MNGDWWAGLAIVVVIVFVFGSLVTGVILSERGQYNQNVECIKAGKEVVGVNCIDKR